MIALGLFSLVFALAGFASATPTTATSSCPQAPLPNPLPAPTTLPNITDLPDPFVFFDNVTTVKSVEDWECRRQELLILMQVRNVVGLTC